MVKFYDPKDREELARVESLLRNRGIEYFVISQEVNGIVPFQIRVAEEDLPAAEALLGKEQKAIRS